MKIFSSLLLPHLKDRNDESETRKAILDLLRILNLVSSNKIFGSEDLGNYTQFDDNGFISSTGLGVSWNDMIFAAAGLRPGATAPTFANLTGGIYAYRFDAGKGESIHGAAEIPHDYMEGTNLDFHVHWCPTTTNTGNIVWGVEYSLAKIGSVLSTATTVSITPLAAPGVVNRHLLTDIVQIKQAGLKIGSVIAFRIFRQNGGTDTFTGNAFLLSAGIHYRADTAGSRLELSK